MLELEYSMGGLLRRVRGWKFAVLDTGALLAIAGERVLEGVYTGFWIGGRDTVPITAPWSTNGWLSEPI
jgi:hypothetical protein